VAIEALVDPLLGAIAGIIEAFSYTIAACVRSLRYLVSSTYRQNLRSELSGRSPLYRVVYLSWGLLFIAVCLAVVVAIAYWLTADTSPASACGQLDSGKALDCAQALKNVLVE
jgi:hypothetical protein